MLCLVFLICDGSPTSRDVYWGILGGFLGADFGVPAESRLGIKGRDAGGGFLSGLAEKTGDRGRPLGIDEGELTGRDGSCCSDCCGGSRGLASLMSPWCCGSAVGIRDDADES